MDDLIRIIKEGCGHDGFLAWLHILVLMDDTVLLSTTRNNMINKVTLLQKYCLDYGMKVNQSKTKFFAISGSETDREPLMVDGLEVKHCNSYVYLGSPFTSDGCTSSAVKAHANVKMSHVLKFVSFISKNNDVPFVVKRRVFEAALMSSLVYGCESWLGADLKPIDKLFNWCVKQLLGVRRTTCNDVCYVESGYPPLKDLIKYNQHKFFHKMWAERSEYQDDPLAFVIRTVINTNMITSRLVRDFITNDVEDLSVAIQRVTANISESESSRRKTYKDINPSFTVHYVYTERHTINENHRISFTRFRVSGHSLACETGRWNRRGRGRLPLEERLCRCGQIQTERHVIHECPLSQHIRQNYQFQTMETVFSDQFRPDVTCNVIHDILSIYK